MRSFYQDRLGTNIRKQHSKKNGVFLQDSARLNLAINSLMPLLNGPAATRRCVPEELLPAMEKRLVMLKGQVRDIRENTKRLLGGPLFG